MRLLEPALVTDPYPHYARWRAEQPVWWAEDVKGWVLSRHDDVRAVLKQSEAFSSAAMGAEVPLPLLTDDPPRHTQLRKLVDRAFTVRMLREMEGEVDALARSFVDAIPADGPVDIVRALTQPLPVAVIARMMGIPVERADDFKRWSDALTSTVASATHESRMRDIAEMGTYFQSLIADRRASPGSDLVSAVVNAEVDGAHLSDAEIVGFNMLLLIAGNETTTNLLGNMLNILAERPQDYTRLAGEPALIPAAVDEALRFDSPVQFLQRRLTRPATFHGQAMDVGDTVTVLTGSANRDEGVYANADRYDIERTKVNHHSFGFGIHFCIGAPLARLEAQCAMRHLVRRFPHIARATPPAGAQDERIGSFLLRGFHHLWLELHP
jgi:cytochrome P450